MRMFMVSESGEEYTRDYNTRDEAKTCTARLVMKLLLKRLTEQLTAVSGFS